MTRSFLLPFLFVLLAINAHANDYPSGEFKVLNTAGFVEEENERRPLKADRSSGMAEIRHQSDNSVVLTIGSNEIRLHPMKDGLASFDWDAFKTTLLHEDDVQALNGKDRHNDVAAWGAELAWQGMGKVQLALLPLGDAGYTGFLVSHPNGKKVVRQMEFRQVLGPARRSRR